MTDDQPALFGTTSKAVTNAKQHTADQRRTQIQLARIGNRVHPLSGDVAGQFLMLHPEAINDRSGAGRRCGNCLYRETQGHRARSYPKCTWPTPGARTGPRMSHGAASDCRAWWPGCTDHEWSPTATAPPTSTATEETPQ